MLACLITASLFAFMAFLIHYDKVTIEDSIPNTQVFTYKLPEPKKHKPVKPMPVKPKPLTTPETPPLVKGSGESILIHDPELNIQAIKPVLSLKDFAKHDSHDARPIVRVNPKYPLKAIKKGIEGWVQLSFDINELGEVINVEVIDSQPQRIFDKEAKRALAKWKYKAKAVEGEYVMQHNLSVQLDFKMDKTG